MSRHPFKRLLACCGVVFAAAGLAAAQVPSTQPAMKSEGRHFRYGVNLHMLWQPPLEKYIDALDELGVDIVRDNLAWETIQPAEGVWNFAECDRIVDACRSRGIAVQSLLGYSPKWASTGKTDTKNFNDWNKAGPRRAAFVEYARRTAEHFKGRVGYWEIWNEPDIEFWLSPTADYTALFNESAKAIVHANPPARVMNGGLTFLSRGPNPTFAAEFLPRADRTHWSIWAYHDYHTFDATVANAKRSDDARARENLQLPVWVNEGGFHTLNPGGELEQASTLVKKYAAAPHFGIEAYIWYEFVDGGLGPAEPEHHFGLLRRDFSPKPAYHAYRQLIRELSPLRFAERLNVASATADLWAMHYADARRGVTVLWQHKGPPVRLTVSPVSGRAVTATDIWGRHVPLEPSADGLVIEVSGQPIYLHADHPNAPALRLINSPSTQPKS